MLDATKSPFNSTHKFCICAENESQIIPREGREVNSAFLLPLLKDLQNVEGAVYIHVCQDSQETCSEDLMLYLHVGASESFPVRNVLCSLTEPYRELIQTELQLHPVWKH